MERGTYKLILLMNRKYANEILLASREGYEKIAQDFSRTRGMFWPELLFVREIIPKNARLLDIGCGNGRFLGTLTDTSINYTGIDFSKGLINVARERYEFEGSQTSLNRPNATFVEGDALALPFPDEYFDMAVSFAVIHHIPSRAYRVQFLREAMRVVKPGGAIIITAWNVWHSRPGDIILSTFKKLTGRAHLDFGDALLGFGKEKNVRYVHALTMREIRSLAKEAGLKIERLEKIRRPSGEENFFIMLRKP